MTERPADQRFEGDDHYLVEWIRQRLAKDPRVGELELQVSVTGRKVIVTGTVANPDRQRAISEVLAEVCPDRAVQNQTTVLRIDAEPQEETLG
jgi:osmotically-inducible protein OsmY